jgi:hypothetical protein
VGDWDLVLRGGRVIDPETGLDAVRDVAVAQARIAAVGTGLAPGQVDVDVAGQVVTAGFIDLHSQVSDIGGLRLQAMDGVKTALELEAGVTRGRGSWRARRRPFSGFAPPGRWPDVAVTDRRTPSLRRLASTRLAAPRLPGGSAPCSHAADLADRASASGVLLGYPTTGGYLRGGTRPRGQDSLPACPSFAGPNLDGPRSPR